MISSPPFLLELDLLLVKYFGYYNLCFMFIVLASRQMHNLGFSKKFMFVAQNPL